MIALVAVMLGAQFPIDTTDLRTVHSGFVDKKGCPVSPDCTDWAKARRNGGKHAVALETWVAGLISGYNLYHPASPADRLNLLEGKKLSDAYKAIDERCAALPDAAVADVTLELVADWRKR
jgi:hypothetical protein